MFHGKFTYFKNCNGKVCKVEKDFSDPLAFEEFMYGQAPMAFVSRGSCDGDSACCGGGDCMVDEIEKLPSGTKISDYHRELQEIESQERERSEMLERKKAGLKELKELRAKFEQKERSDIVEKIDADIASLESEMKEVKKSV